MECTVAYHASHEQSSPRELLRYAMDAEPAGAGSALHRRLRERVLPRLAAA